MNKKQFWELAWTVGTLGWFFTLIVMIMGASFPDDGLDPPPWFFILWVGVPLVWMICGAFILNGPYGYQLGWREQYVVQTINGEVIKGYRAVDTTPAKRITLQWLAPFAAMYFWLSGKERYKQIRIS
jgi:hypothetical protein